MCKPCTSFSVGFECPNWSALAKKKASIDPLRAGCVPWLVLPNVWHYMAIIELHTAADAPGAHGSVFSVPVRASVCNNCVFSLQVIK